jgi:hypothetical protein
MTDQEQKEFDEWVDEQARQYEEEEDGRACLGSSTDHRMEANNG